MKNMIKRLMVDGISIPINSYLVCLCHSMFLYMQKYDSYEFHECKNNNNYHREIHCRYIINTFGSK